MSSRSTIATYLPPWGSAARRVAGPDEDAVTMAVAAGLRAVPAAGPAAPAEDRGTPVGGPVQRVVLVTRDPALLSEGSAAALLAGLGLSLDVACSEVLGGAPATLDALISAAPGTLLIGVDLDPAGAAAVYVGKATEGAAAVRRLSRSLPVLTRSADGARNDYDDERLMRERGVNLSLERLGLAEPPVAVAGLTGRQAEAISRGTPPALPTLGASATLFAVAALAEQGLSGTLLAVEQASVVAAHLSPDARVDRCEPAARALPATRTTPGPDIPISLPAYERAFEPKLRWEAGRCTACGTLAFPPRYRCLECGAERSCELTPLPRTGEVYTCATIHVPVPGMATPYSLAIVDLDGVEVRSLVQVSGGGPVEIGDRGELVFRRVAVRTGVPDYGYSFVAEGVFS